MRVEWIVVAVLAAAALYAIVVFNRLIRLRNLVREGWSGIDVQLKRRSDLIPNLVETVRAYASHERTLFEEVVEKRNAALHAMRVADKDGAERALQGSLGRLLALAEAYPDLKANQNFLKLQDQLSELEDHLQMARRYYNGAVRDYNIDIQSFPDVLVARFTGFREEPFFQIDAAEAARPDVRFEGRAP
ncbi:MAG: LemA family protein [Alphaproteobacteria bacterium]|nr:LemA family protein [Alphaproteobacteria bacterium]